MNRFGRLSRSIGTISVALGAVASGAIDTASPARAATDQMTLIAQELALEQDSPLIIRFIPATPINAETDTIIVGAYRRIDSRLEVTDAIAGRYGRVVDSVRINPLDPASFAIDADGLVTITVASESANGTPEALQFPRSGLYPVTVEVQQDGGVLGGELLTFVDRLTAPTELVKDSLAVTVVASITGPPAIPAVDTPLSEDVINQINEVVQYPPTVALSVSISPEVLGRLDEKTYEALRTVMARSLVLAQPSIPLDPSAAAAAGQQDLFTQLLQAGENETTDRVATRPTRSAWIETEPLTPEGAALLRSRGVTLLLLSPETYADAGLAGGYLQDYTLYSQLRNTQLEDGSSVATAVFDPTINRHLVNQAMSPELAALYTAADLVAWRDQLQAAQGSVTGHSVLLGLPGGGVLDRERIARLVELLDATGAATFTDLIDFARTTDVQPLGNAEATLNLAPQQPTALVARAPILASLAARQRTVSSMLVVDGGRTDRWKRTIQVLASSSITDTQVEATAATLTEQFDAITSAVIAPQAYTFTMNGLSTNLYPRITNTSDEQLKVVVQMQASADKMQFPDGDQAMILEPLTGTPLPISVRARSNGSFTVTLQVMAPDGITPITPKTILKAQVNAFTGLAQVLTGGGLLILLTWWVHNLRRSRRARRNTTALATTGTATITAAHTIVQLDTSAASAEPASPPSTTLSDL